MSAARCPNCNGNLEAFCASCGQQAPSPRDYSLPMLARHALEQLASYDGRVWRTVRVLLFQPGTLARDHFEGRRARYLTPFRIFVLANVGAWLLIPWLGIKGFTLELAFERAIAADFWRAALASRAGLSGLTAGQFTPRIDALGAAEDSVAVLCMCPLFALGLSALLAKRGFRYVHHLVFAAHFYCIHLLALMLSWAVVIAPLTRLLVSHGVMSGGYRVLWFMHLAVAPFLFVYLRPAIGKAYALTGTALWWRSACASVWACVVSRAFLDIAFGLALVFA